MQSLSEPLPHGPSRRLRLPALAVAALVASCGGLDDSPYASTENALCPAGSTVEGVDVSVYQGNVDWTAVKNSGRGFAIARVSDGSYLDTTFDQNWAGIKAAGLVRGVYQFFEPGEDPTAQANIVIQKVGMLGNGDLPAVADVEVTGGQSAATIAANLQTWIARVQAGTGKTPMIYSSPGWWNSHVGSTAFGGDPLWVANWGVSCPSLPTGWSNFKVWQYSDSGSVSGIPATVDLDRFNGSMADLQAYTNSTPPYAAKYVSQSWAFATMTIPMTAGQIIHANIVLRNVGSATWDSNTHLATTQPRDRSSPFANGTWLAPNRLAGVTGTVPPGGTFQFNFDFQAPMQPGMYDEFYGMVEDGVTWFSDPGQGGPPDNQIEAKFLVMAAPPDAGNGSANDAGTVDTGGADAGDLDAGAVDAGDLDAGAVDAGPVVVGLPDGGGDPFDAGPADAGKPATNRAALAQGGCGCGSTSGASLPLMFVLVLAACRQRYARRTAVRAASER